MLVSLFKWPVALGVALLTPAAAFSGWQLIVAAWEANLWKSPFALGFVAAFLLLNVFREFRFVKLWSTIDHEVTHALFAWLTFVPVRGISATDGSEAGANSGRVGHVALDGENWLILIAPYFFPTASVLVLALVWALAAEPTVLASSLLGMATAWSITSRWHDTHLEQTDLRSVGLGFALLFLPGANLFCYGALLANELGGPSQTFSFTSSAVEITAAWVRAWIA